MELLPVGWAGGDRVNPTIHHCKTLVDRLGIEVIAESILVCEFIAEGTIVVAISTTGHQGGQELVTDKLVRCRHFRLGGSIGIGAGTSQLHVM